MNAVKPSAGPVASGGRGSEVLAAARTGSGSRLTCTSVDRLRLVHRGAVPPSRPPPAALPGTSTGRGSWGRRVGMAPVTLGTGSMCIRGAAVTVEEIAQATVRSTRGPSEHRAAGAGKSAGNRAPPKGPRTTVPSGDGRRCAGRVVRLRARPALGPPPDAPQSTGQRRTETAG